MNDVKRFYTYANIGFSCRINILISFIRKIPGMDKVISPQVYRWYRAKRSLSVVGALYDILYLTVAGAAEAYILTWLIPEWILGREPFPAECAFSFILVFCIANGFSSCDLFTAGKDDNLFLRHFMVDPREYYRYKALRLSVWKYIPLAALFGFLLSDWKMAAALCLLKCMFSLAGNVLYLEYFNKKHHILPAVYRRVIPAILFISCYAILYKGFIPEMQIPDTVIICCSAVSLFGCALMWKYHREYSDYYEMAMYFKESGVLIMSGSVSSADAESSNEKLGRITWQENQEYFERNKGLKIYDYMEKAFWERLGGGIRKQRVTNMAVVFLFYTIAGLLSRMDKIAVNSSNIQTYSTILAPVSLLFSQAATMTQLHFYNIDSYLLALNAYSAPVIQHTALYRFRKTVITDILLSIFHFVCMIIFFFLSGCKIPLTSVVSFGLLGFIILLLVDLYELIIYFYIQPYSKDMSVQNPLLKILGIAGSIIGLLGIFIRKNLFIALPVLAAAALAMCIGFCVFSRFIVYTFKLKS